METWWLKGKKTTGNTTNRNSICKSISNVQSSSTDDEKLISRTTPPTPVSQSRVYVHDTKVKPDSFANLIDIDN